MYWVSGSGLPDIRPFLISDSGSGSGCKLPDNEPDIFLTKSLSWQIAFCTEMVNLSKK